MKRRNFIKQTASAAAASIVAGGGILLLGNRSGQAYDHQQKYQLKDWRVPDDTNRPILASAKGGNWRKATAAAIGALGGMEAFIKSGDNVCIKPNIGWDRTAQMGANTHPDVVAELIRLCLAAGADKVVVVDVTCNAANRTYNRSGIKAASETEGAKIIIPGESNFAKVDFGAESLGIWKVLKPILECDKLINVPVVKHHSLSGMTAGMKNWFGAISGPRNLLHQNINENIAELARLFKPTLIVSDATRVLQRNGPTGGRVDDVITFDTVIASTDQVASDSYVTRYLSLDSDRFPYLKMAEEMGVGQIAPPSDKIAEIEV
jgi:uncharacterized protein (DUF362 family)